MTDTRKSAAEKVYEDLRHLILSGQLVASQSLKSAALRTQFGFSSTPLREALNRLSAEHLVVNTFNQGFCVAPISLEELADLDRSRHLLEIDMFVSSLQNGDDDWEGRIVAAHYQLSKLTPPDIDASADAFALWNTRHQAFHDALVSGCKSRWMHRLLGQIETQLTRYHHNILIRSREVVADKFNLTVRVNQKLADAMDIHKHTHLMEAALERNNSKASQLMADHIRLTSDVFQSIQAIFPENVPQKLRRKGLPT